MIYPRCKAPGCKSPVIREKSKNGLCIKHEDMLNFLLWALPQIKLTQEPRLPGLWLPGDPVNDETSVQKARNR